MSNIHVVYAFSDNYYSSVATLNEMGAAWVMRCKWTGLLLPGFIFDKLAGCIDKNQICIKLDDPDIITLKQRLRQFRDDIIKEFGLESIDEDEWEEKRDDFLNKIKIIAQKKDIEITSSESVNESNKTKAETRFDGRRSICPIPQDPIRRSREYSGRRGSSGTDGMSCR